MLSTAPACHATEPAVSERTIGDCAHPLQAAGMLFCKVRGNLPPTADDVDLWPDSPAFGRKNRLYL
jgi:hypothetical protein